MAESGSVQQRKSFLRSLLLDKRANTLAIGAAAILPLIGVIGGGVDASRMYLAKSRLQQACDSATLAARKKLAGGTITDGSIPTDIEDHADSFFETNFGDGTYGTSDTEYELTSSVGTRMDGTAQTSVPATLMTVFGYDKIELNVDCSADLNLPNIDISLVLDMSGSMRHSVNGAVKMTALKKAVFAFYDEIMAVAPEDAQVRIGIIPYNSNMNVGKLISDVNSDFISSNPKYESRFPVMGPVMTDPGSDGGEELYDDGRELVTRDKSKLGSSTLFDYAWSNNSNHSTYGRTACRAYDGTYTVNGERWVISDEDYIKNYFRDGNGNRYAACEARVRKYRTTEASPPTYENGFLYWEYRQGTQDASVYKTFEQASAPIGSQGANVLTKKWDGCIEEADTVVTTDFTPIPTNAHDLNIDLIPDSEATRWRPQWNDVTYDRRWDVDGNVRRAEDDYENAGSLKNTKSDCPVPAYPLTEYPLDGTDRNDDFEDRINAMSPTGFTLHDIGMIWGGRILSPDGIFSSTNRTAPNGDPIIRHLIFMTDGNMDPGPYDQNVYGSADMEGRIAGFKTGTKQWDDDGVYQVLKDVHNARLDAVCEQIKNKNITVWTVSFANSLNDHTRGCASSESRAMTANDQTTLIDRFRTIATSIAELRLVD